MFKRVNIGDFKEKLRLFTLTNIQVGFILAIAFFIFQVSQSWVDNGINASILRWVLPSALSITIISLFASLFFILNSKNKEELIPPAKGLALAIIEYGLQLHADGRDRALVNLRNNFSITLHILGFHKIRTQLGEIAIQSATIMRDNAAKAEIFVDDLGWANYLLDRNAIAIKNIERGVEIASISKSLDQEDFIRLSLCEAKGLRHLAIITNEDDPKGARTKLNKALNILKSLEDQSVPEVKRDIAQIHHARALITAMSFDIHKSGTLRQGDVEGVNLVNEALEQVRRASSIFKDIGDLDRYVKALFLEVRLLESKGAKTEAMEVSALCNRTLASSEWVRLEGTQTLTGK
jgi:hypothetical protein